MKDRPARIIEERPTAGELPLWHHPEWLERMPWLLQGATGRGKSEEPFDLGLFGREPVGTILARWEQLRQATGMRRVVHSLQVHAAELRSHGAGGESGLLVGRGHDGHLTRSSGVLLTVSIADCVPVYVVDAANRSLGLAHAGWRGIAAGIVERAIERVSAWRGEAAAELWLHCGPAICGRCYEVGPEVHAAVAPESPVPTVATPIDLRAAITRRAVSAGIDVDRITISAHCTRCGPGDFFSHRAGSPARQMGFLGLRAQAVKLS